MFTQAQMERYRESMEFYKDEELVPPRTYNINDYPDFPGSGDEFGEGQLLILGVVDQTMVDCECDHDHVIYMAIREDGMIGEEITSNSVGEGLTLHPEADLLALMLEDIHPSELGEGIAPTWDEMREVTPDEWPADVPVTDMSAFEGALDAEWYN